MTVQKITLAMFGTRLVMQAASYEEAVVIGMRKTAVFGKTAVVRTIKRTKDPFRIRASGTYEAPGNWVTEKIPDGAVLAPISKNSLFVERGREPGKMPPKKEIWNWVQQKRLVPKTRKKDQTSRLMVIAAITKAVRFKIMKHGTKARWPLRRTMPVIANHAQREVKKQLRLAAGHKPRKRKR